MCKFRFNPYRKDNPEWLKTDYTELASDDIINFHKSLKGYKPTPLLSLPALSQKLGLGAIYVKDESSRFGIKAFKALGASYAIYMFLKTQWELKFDTEFTPQLFADKEKMNLLGKYTFCAASDGNHGKAVAWTARMLEQNAIIYMPGDTVEARIKNIENEGARVVVVKNGTYDDCVSQIAKDVKGKKDWVLISDTACEGYTLIPKYIMAGYSTVFKELEDTINPPDSPQIDYVFLQTGAGGFCGAGMWYYNYRYGSNRPVLISVEPTEADCFLESICYGNGNPLPTKRNQKTIMAGLNCGTPSLTSWPIIRDTADLFISIADCYAEIAIRRFYYPENGDPSIISCESGAGGMAGLMALFMDKNLEYARQKLQFNKNSKILVINTEGDTDPVNFKKIIDKGPL